jgi:hypothetical protein
MLSRNKMPQHLTRASLAGAFVLILATAASAQEAPPKPSDKPRREDIQLVVQNDNYWDMHIYAMRGGLYRSLGIVTGLSTAELKVPEYLTLAGADFQVIADPIGSNLSYMTGPIVMGNAREIDLSVGADLALSSYVLKDGPAGNGSS